jgi:hypothetical protein
MNLNFEHMVEEMLLIYFMMISYGLREETEVGYKKFRFTNSVIRSEIYEKRAQILLTYQRETVKNKPRQKYLTTIA